jgi:hypothetical protein
MHLQQVHQHVQQVDMMKHSEHKQEAFIAKDLHVCVSLIGCGQSTSEHIDPTQPGARTISLNPSTNKQFCLLGNSDALCIACKHTIVGLRITIYPDCCHFAIACCPDIVVLRH